MKVSEYMSFPLFTGDEMRDGNYRADSIRHTPDMTYPISATFYKVKLVQVDTMNNKGQQVLVWMPSVETSFSVIITGP